MASNLVMVQSYLCQVKRSPRQACVKSSVGPIRLCQVKWWSKSGLYQLKCRLCHARIKSSVAPFRLHDSLERDFPILAISTKKTCINFDRWLICKKVIIKIKYLYYYAVAGSESHNFDELRVAARDVQEL